MPLLAALALMLQYELAHLTVAHSHSKRGNEMTGKSPKELLSGQDLIGFKRFRKGEDQVPCRASSAKVTVEPGWPAKGTEPKRSEDKSRS